MSFVLMRSGAASAGSAEADWVARISGTGVVWYHNFENQAEVDNYRFEGGIGTDKNNTGDGNTRWVSGDGFAGGGCVELNVPNNDISASGWWRPYSPMNGTSNGRGADDPGANGTISLKAYDPTDNGAYNWTQGYYGHSSYATGSFDGTAGFYCQCRVKMSANRAAPTNPDGKLFYFDQPNGSDQEIVIKSGNNSGTHLRFNMYTNFGSRSNSFMYEPQDDGDGPHSSYQPGGSYSGTCTDLDNDDSGSCFLWPTDEWVTMLYYMLPGRHNVAETVIRVWMARYGETSYTKIWDKSNYIMLFDPAPNAYNVLKLAAYMNSNPAVGGGFYHRYTQIVFSKDTIPCPQVYT